MAHFHPLRKRMKTNRHHAHTLNTAENHVRCAPQTIQARRINCRGMPHMIEARVIDYRAMPTIDENGVQPVESQRKKTCVRLNQPLRHRLLFKVNRRGLAKGFGRRLSR
jgi:hypothetical protein